jgi:metal-sulfur cluster biosynthetic enzyme
MTLTEGQVIEILKKINHPGAGKDIVSLSMIKDIIIGSG